MFTCLRIFFKLRVHEKVNKNKVSLLVPVNQLNYSNVSDTYILCLMTKHGFCDCRKKTRVFSNQNSGYIRERVHAPEALNFKCSQNINLKSNISLFAENLKILSTGARKVITCTTSFLGSFPFSLKT